MGTFADAVPSITAWCFGLAFAWIVAYTVCRMTSAFKEKPALAAINFVHMVPIVALCYHGVVGYRALPGTLEERMYDYDASAYEICVVQIALQLFITASALGTRDKSLLKPELLAHHSVTATLMYLCLEGPFAHSYMSVFFGLTEISTIPLNVMDTLKNFKDVRKAYPTLDLAAKMAFAVLFLSLRVGLSTKLSVDFQRDLYAVFAGGDLRGTCAFMSVSNVFVVGLQRAPASLAPPRCHHDCFPSSQVLLGDPDTPGPLQDRRRREEKQQGRLGTPPRARLLKSGARESLGT